jgi:hypothetical protein
MEFRIVAGGPHATMVGNSIYSPHQALGILQANPAIEAEDIETGKRYGLAGLERLITKMTIEGKPAPGV